MVVRRYRIGPSYLTFLLSECPRCFALQVKHGRPRPRTPMPKIFTVIDGAMKHRFDEPTWHGCGPGQPRFIVEAHDRDVCSEVIPYLEHGVELVIRGRLDTQVRFDDGTRGVVDFKTAVPSPESTDLYRRQNAAYQYAINHPGSGGYAPGRIDRTGLLVFNPARFTYDGNASAGLHGALTYVDTTVDEARFVAFLERIARLLSRPELPPVGARCAFSTWCAGIRAA